MLRYRQHFIAETVRNDGADLTKIRRFCFLEQFFVEYLRDHGTVHGVALLFFFPPNQFRGEVNI